MLKTLEMLLAGMWNTAARKFLNDDAIEDVRQTYATQIRQQCRAVAAISFILFWQRCI